MTEWWWSSGDTVGDLVRGGRRLAVVRENEMGDFLPQQPAPPPGHAGAAEYERLRLQRRFERYRQLHASRQQQYDSFAPCVYNQQAHETQLLHRRWQDSKKPQTAKSAAASAKMSSRVGDAGLPSGAVPAAAATVTSVCRGTLSVLA